MVSSMEIVSSEIETIIDLILKIILILLIGFVILIIGYVIKQFIKKFRYRFPNSLNGITIIISFIQIIVWFGFAAYVLNFSPTIILGSSALIVTMIGISALGSFGSNILGGFWIILTHPYGVGDFITSANNPQYSGLVIDVSINYTKILRLNRKVVIVPNGIMVNSIIMNSNILLDKNYILEHHLEKIGQKAKLTNLPGNIIDSIYYGEYVYFTFNFEIKVELVKPEPKIEIIKEKLEIICNNFAPVFGFRPEYYFIDYTSRLLVTMKLITKDPKVILYKYSDIVQEIANKLYLDKFFKEDI
jgi:hypothetical protein